MKQARFGLPVKPVRNLGYSLGAGRNRRTLRQENSVNYADRWDPNLAPCDVFEGVHRPYRIQHVVLTCKHSLVSCDGQTYQSFRLYRMADIPFLWGPKGLALRIWISWISSRLVTMMVTMSSIAPAVSPAMVSVIKQKVPMHLSFYHCSIISCEANPIAVQDPLHLTSLPKHRFRPFAFLAFHCLQSVSTLAVLSLCLCVANWTGCGPVAVKTMPQ